MIPAGLKQRVHDLLGPRGYLDRPEDLALYEYDGGVDKHPPELVAFPRSTAEVAALVKLAAEFGVPFVGRGAGTGLSGGAIPREGGLMIAFARMNRILGRPGIGQNQGLFRVRPLVDSRAFPEVGFYRQEDEMREYGNTEPLLRQIAASTGGRFGVKPGDAFEAAGRSIPANMELWPGLLALGLGLNLLELVMRKWKGLLEALHLTPVEAA